MHIRTVYFKISDMSSVVRWWSAFLEQSPHKSFEAYSEFKCGDIRLGFVLNSFGDEFTGNRGVLMLECESDEELCIKIELAKELNARVLSDNLGSDLNSISMEDPYGNEFELGFLNHD